MEDFLRLENIAYSMDIHSILHPISLELEQGKNIVFFGSENSGIDKICPIISGAIDDYDGNVIFKGVSMRNASYIQRNIIRRDLVYLQRGYGLISNMTVFENIALPLRYHTKMTDSEIEKYVTSIIEEMELELCSDLRPHALHNSEKLKTAYARAISLKPDFLLVEFPVEGQCMINILSFLRSLDRWAESDVKSAIIVSHEPRTFRNVGDRFIMLYHGKIVFDGNRDELDSMENPYVKQYIHYSAEGPMDIF